MKKKEEINYLLKIPLTHRSRSLWREDEENEFSN